MLSLLCRGSACTSITCSSILDLSKSSGYNTMDVQPGASYCLRFIYQYGVFTMNQIGHATAGLYYSAHQNYYISNYNYISMMDSKNAIGYLHRSVNFNIYYGYIYITTSDAATISYTYHYASSNCTWVALSSMKYGLYSLPNNSRLIFAPSTYCFLYAAYGSQSITIYRSSDQIGSNDNMYYSYNMNESTVPFGYSRYSASSPFQVAYTIGYSSDSQRYSAIFSSNAQIQDAEVEGTFTSNSISYIDWYNTDTGSSSDSSDNTTAIIIAGSVVAMIIIIVAAFMAIINSANHSVPAATVDYTAIPSSEICVNGVPSTIPTIKKVGTQYKSPENAQFSGSIQPYAIPSTQIFVETSPNYTAP